MPTKYLLSGLKEQNKKRLIAALLFISCVVSGYMLFITSANTPKRIQNLAQADSLIQQELSNFNISPEQVQISTISVDSNFSRKLYHIGVPYGFSKTQLHSELNHLLAPYNIQAPANVTLPEQDVNIQLTYKGTVIRTLVVQTDPDLVLKHKKLNLLFSFEEVPDTDFIERLSTLGEPIPLVLKIQEPTEAENIDQELDDRYRRVIFWLQNDRGEDLIRTNPGKAISKLKQLQKLVPDAKIVYFNHSDQPLEQTRQQLMSKTNLSFVYISNVLMMHEGSGKSEFLEQLQKLQKNPDLDTGLISGSQTTLDWLSEQLPALKKAGAQIVAPSQTTL